MAIYHLNAQIISRAKGRSATAAAAYRAAESIADLRTGLVFNYTQKREVIFTAIYAPIDAPAWCDSRTDLWNHVERVEVRRDAQVARELNVALPRELSLKSQIALLQKFVTTQFVSIGMVADVAIHANASSVNPHAHILLTLRTITASGFANKCRLWNDREILETWREEWALHCNRALQDIGAAERVDHRTLVAQRASRLPTVHEGPRWSASKDKNTFNQKTNITIKEMNMKSSNDAIHTERPAEGTVARLKLERPRINNKEPHLFFTPLGDNTRDLPRAIRAENYPEALKTLLGSPAPLIEWEQTSLGACWHIKLADGDVYDYGSQIRCASGSESEIATALSIAKKNGWSGLHLTGDAGFKKRAFVEAIAQGFDAATITGYKASASDIEVGLALSEDRQRTSKNTDSNKMLVTVEESSGERGRKRKLTP